jgi:arylsulfatase A-like enzyme
MREPSAGNFNSSFGVDEPATVERMLAWIDKLPTGQRFFLHYLPIAGHHPYATPERGPFPESDDAGQYLNALHYGDVALGKFLDALRHRGLDANTLFVIYGDHGEAFGQHEGNYGHTLFIYEENIRVPLIVSMPGALNESKRSKRMASLIDLAPTVLDLLGLAVPPDFQGTSLLADDVQRASLFFTDYSLPLAGIRDEKWKLIAELNSSRMKLFDIEADPGENAQPGGAASGARSHLEPAFAQLGVSAESAYPSAGREDTGSSHGSCAERAWQVAPAARSVSVSPPSAFTLSQRVHYRRRKHQTKPPKPITAITAPTPNHKA